jgi:hypothetical protein
MASKEQVETQFKAWVSALNRQVNEAVGLKLTDLPELPCREAFDEGKLPAEYFDDTVREELEKLGFALELNDVIDDAAFDNLMAAESEEPYGEDFDEAA